VPIPFDQIKRASLSQADSLLASWFPLGRKIGREFKIGNVSGEPGESLSVNLDTGVWSDFATGQKGADLIDLRAASLHKSLGDTARELATSLGITDAPPPPKKANGHSRQPGWHPIVPPPAGVRRPSDLLDSMDVVYEYTDASGAITHYVGRIEARGTERKRFVPVTYGTFEGHAGWHKKSPLAPRPLYGLGRLAARPTSPVVLCEGEKAADAAQALLPSYACLAWPNGAESADKADLGPLLTRKVVIWPDNDEPGHKAAKFLATQLPRASTLRVDDLLDGADAADVTPLEPERWLMLRIQKPFSRIKTGEEFMASFVAPDYIIDGIVQRTRLYACTSKTGHGKTAVWLYLSCMVTTGRHIGPLETTKGNVVFLAGENPDDLCGRMHAACQEYNIDPQRAPHVLPVNFPMTPEEAARLKDDIDALALDPVLIVADTAAAYFPGDDDNSNVQMGEYGRTLRILNRCTGNPAVVVLSHPVKAADRDNLLPRGGGAFLNELDGNLTLWSDSLGENTTLHWQGKLRGADFDPIPFILRPIRVPTLLDAKKRPLVSVIAEPQSPEGAANRAKQAISDENAVLLWLRTQPGISLAGIADGAGWTNERGIPLKAKVQRCLERLKMDKLVKIHRRKWVITDTGKAELNKSDPE